MGSAFEGAPHCPPPEVHYEVVRGPGSAWSFSAAGGHQCAAGTSGAMEILLGASSVAWDPCEVVAAGCETAASAPGVGSSCFRAAATTRGSLLSVGERERPDRGLCVAAPLPDAVYAAAVAWDGARAYLFGGQTGSGKTDAIVEYDPAAGSARVLPTPRLPSPRTLASAVWIGGTEILVLGGGNGPTEPTHEVLRFDTVTHTLTSVGEGLPSPVCCASAFWDGHHVFIVGGFGGDPDRPEYMDEIVRYDPATGAADVGGRLPTVNGYSAAVWNGRHAFIFGGWDGTAPVSDVLRYDPQEGTVEVVASLPTARWGTSAVRAGERAYLFGGCEQWPCLGVGSVATITSYDWARNEAVDLAASLPTPRTDGAAVFDGSDRVFVLGGRMARVNPAALDDVDRFLDEVVRFDVP